MVIPLKQDYNLNENCSYWKTRLNDVRDHSEVNKNKNKNKQTNKNRTFAYLAYRGAVCFIFDINQYLKNVMSLMRNGHSVLYLTGDDFNPILQ